MNQTSNPVLEVVALTLAGLGISYAPHVFLGGMFLALAGAFAAARILSAEMIKNAKPLSFWGTVSTGFFVSMIVALATDHWFHDFPVQFMMGVAGFVSSFVGPAILKIVARLSQRTDVIADRALDKVLPDTSRDKD
jgi:hypothetical protein